MTKEQFEEINDNLNVLSHLIFQARDEEKLTQEDVNKMTVYFNKAKLALLGVMYPDRYPANG